MTNREKYIIENVALNARQSAIEKDIISQETTSLSVEDVRRIVVSFGGELQKDKSTRLVKTDSRKFTIYYHPNASMIDILHELGHAFFDLPNMEIGHELSCEGVGISDLRASLFARAYIMPRDDFENVVIHCAKDGKCDVQKVAEIYDVDYFNVLTRGEELNIWG